MVLEWLGAYRLKININWGRIWHPTRRAQRFWCILDLPGCYTTPGQPPLPLVHIGTGLAASEFRRFFQRLEKGRPGERSSSVGRTGLKGMIASGPQTASPRVRSEVVLATKSACPSSLEASQVSPIVFVMNQFAPLGALWPQSTRLHPSVYTASRSRTLSVPSVSGS